MIDLINEIYNKIVSNCRGIIYKKKLASKIITRGSFPLRPGLWIIGPDFSRNIAVKKLPPPLDKVKQWGGWRSDKILKVFVRLSRLLIYPWVAYTSKQSVSKYVADVVLLNRLNETVGFDLKVIKPISHHQLRVIETSVLHLSKIYTCVSFQVDYKAGYIFENMISGSVFSVVSDEVRSSCVNGFFEGLQVSTPMELDSESVDRWHTACHELLPQIPCAELFHHNIIKHIDEIITDSKRSWIHGDLFGENIIVTTDGAVVIDYDKACIAPTFTDIMTLFVFEARTLRFDLMDNFFKGEFDQEFADIVCQFDGDDTFIKKVAIFISWLGWKTTTEKFSSINMSRFLDVLERYFSVNKQRQNPIDQLIDTSE